MKNIFGNAYGLTAILSLAVFIGGIGYFYLARYNEEAKLKGAIDLYKKGEIAVSVGEREKAFNQSLSILTALESVYRPEFGTGKLYYDIGNTYFQLGAYPWSIFYYYQADRLMPRNDTVHHNLSIALDKLHLPPLPEEDPVRAALFFHSRLSLPERLQLSAIFGIFLLFFSSLFLWTQAKVLKTVIAFCVLCAVILLGSLFYSRYLSPVEGVMVKSSSLYRDAGEQYAKVTEKLLSGGMKIQVISTSSDGLWIKVLTPDGLLGYVPQTSLRILYP